MILTKSTLGPNPYVGGGFTVTFGEFERINSAVVKCDRDDILGAVDTAYGIRVTIATNVVTIILVAASTVGGPGNAWAEFGGGAINGRTFTVIADGE